MKKKGVLLVAHGSRRQEANQELFGQLERLRRYFEDHPMEAAFMELAHPSIEEAVGALLEQGVEELLVLPYFLFKGMHTTKDIPNKVVDSLRRRGSGVVVRMLEPVGVSPLMFDILRDALLRELSPPLRISEVPPQDIEKESMRIIDDYLGQWHIPEEFKPVVKRVIHTTGDFEYIRLLQIHPEALRAGVDALKRGSTIYTDVTMVRSGINKRYGHTVECILNDDGVKELAERRGITRAAASILTLEGRLNDNIVVIGNAPTALLCLVELIRRGRVRPALVVATPVGFVNARESKLYLEQAVDVPYITSRGFKGGSTVAAAIVNALMKIAFEERANTL